MIVLTAKYKALPGMRDKILEVAAPCVAATRQEKGNLEYTLYLSSEDPDGILCFERWENAACLQAHGTQPHYTAFGEARKPLFDPESFQLNVYQVEDKQ